MYKVKYTNLRLRTDNFQIAQILNKRFDYNILVLSRNGCLNIGNMIRTANLYGVKRFFIFGKNFTNYTYKYVNIIRINQDFINNTKNKFDPELFSNIMNKYNIVPVFIEQSKDAIKLNEFNWNYQFEQIPLNKEICIIMSNDLYGLPTSIIQTKDQFNGSFSIKVPSYNINNWNDIIINSLFNYNIKKNYDIYL